METVILGFNGTSLPVRILCTRSRLAVLDRIGLERRAGECCSKVSHGYKRLLSDPRALV